MTNERRKPGRSDPASPEPSQARPERRDYAAGGRAPDPTERYMRVLKELDEHGRKLAETLGLPAEAVIGTLTPEQRLAQDMAELDREIEEDLGIRVRKRTRARPEAPAKAELTPEQLAAREAAVPVFRRLSRGSSTVH